MGPLDTKQETPEPQPPKRIVTGHWRTQQHKDGSTTKVWVSPHTKKRADQ